MLSARSGRSTIACGGTPFGYEFFGGRRELRYAVAKFTDLGADLDVLLAHPAPLRWSPPLTTSAVTPFAAPRVASGQNTLSFSNLIAASARFGPLLPAVGGRLAQATPEQLERWAERVLDDASLDDVFAGN